MDFGFTKMMDYSPERANVKLLIREAELVPLHMGTKGIFNPPLPSVLAAMGRGRADPN